MRKHIIAAMGRAILLTVALFSMGLLASSSWGQASPEVADCVFNVASDPELAVRSCTEAIKSGRVSYQDLPLIIMARGKAYFNMRQYELAIADFDRLTRMNVVDEQVSSYRGRAYAMAGRFDRAVQDFDQGIRLNPKGAYLYYDRGLVEFCLGQYLIAQHDFGEAVKWDAKSVEFALMLYISEARSGLDARSDLEKNEARLSRKKWPGIVIDLYLGRIGQEEILSSARSSDKNKEKDQLADAYFYLAERALIVGNRPEAIALLGKWVETAGTDADEFSVPNVELRRLLNEGK